MKTMFYITARICLAVGILCLAGAATGYLFTGNFHRHAAITTGTVIDMVSYHTGGDPAYAPVVTYYDNNSHLHTYISPVYANPAAYTIGERIHVYYNPQHPETAQLARVNTHTGLWLLLLVGLLAGGIGGVLLYYQPAPPPEQWVLPNGQAVVVEFVKVRK